MKLFLPVHSPVRVAEYVPLFDEDLDIPSIYDPLRFPIYEPFHDGQVPSVRPSSPTFEFGDNPGYAQCIPEFDFPFAATPVLATPLPSPPPSSTSTPAPYIPDRLLPLAKPPTPATPSSPANQAPSTPAASFKRKSYTSPPRYRSRRPLTASVDLSSSDDRETILRKQNTAAARRYRKRKEDREKELELAMQEASAENQRLRTEVAILKGKLR